MAWSSVPIFLCLLVLVPTIIGPASTVAEIGSAKTKIDWVVDEGPQNARIHNCCLAQGARPICMPVCKVTVTAQELIHAFSKGCYDQLRILLYCASEGHDNRRCCARSKTPSLCLIFCAGRAPPMCQTGRYTLMNLMECAKSIDVISKCHQANLTAEPQWVKGYNFPPDLPCDD